MRYAICLLLASAAGSSFAATIVEPITGGTADLIPSSLGSTSGVERFSLFGADFTFTGTADQLSSFYACGPVIICPAGTAVPGLSGDIGTLTGVPVSGRISFQGASYDYTEIGRASCRERG